MSHSFCLFLALFVSLLKWVEETGDVDVFSMSSLTDGSCSTQLSCQHPNTTVDSIAGRLTSLHSLFPAFFLSSLTSLRRTCLSVAHHYYFYELPVDVVAGVFVASRFLPSASVRHTSTYKKKNEELDPLRFFFFFLFLSKEYSLNSTLENDNRTRVSEGTSQEKKGKIEREKKRKEINFISFVAVLARFAADSVSQAYR